MKYQAVDSVVYEVVMRSVITTSNDVDFVSFPAVFGNPNYDSFLIQADLTDKQVHALTPNVWYDLPTEETI